MCPAMAKKLSPSARALAELKPKDVEWKEFAEQLQIHRTMLWRFVSGDRKPDLETALKIQRLTGGKVPADGWSAASRKRTGTDG